MLFAKNSVTRLTLICASLLALSIPVSAQAYGRARDLVQRVQNDLQVLLREHPRNGHERERIDNARKHLSDLDRNLSRDHFDKDRLDEAIDDVKNIVDHNTLSAQGRDALSADLADLRSMRATRGR